MVRSTRDVEILWTQDSETHIDGRDYVVTAGDMTDTERHAFTEKGRRG